jgi:DNA polymerase III epsilon subunit-like protein
MNGFAKDILLIDFEGTGLVLDESEPSQLGAILLDRQSLEEKGSFVSYIAIDHPDKFAQEAIEISGITPDMLKDAPTRKEVADKFLKQFSTTPFLASWNTTFDQAMMRLIMKSIGKDIFEFDYHYFDVWPVVYSHLAQHGHGDIVRLEPTLAHFGLKARGKHDALEDCRVTAEVLRKVYFAKD